MEQVEIGQRGQRGTMRKVAASASGLSFRALIRDDAPEQRAAIAERRLVRTVAEWTPGAGLDIVLASAPTGDRVSIELRPLGPVRAGWQADVRGALDQIAELSSTGGRPQREAPHALAELLRDPARSQTSPAGDLLRPADGQALRAPAISWPVVVREPGADVLTALRRVRGGFVRALLAAPTDLERGMLDEQLREGWDRLAHPAFDAYLGAPIRMRTFVGVGGDGSGYAGLRAVVRGWGSALVLHDVDASGRTRFWSSEAGLLAGHVRPEGWALAGLRLPVAGDRATQGMPSRPRPLAERPMNLPPLREPDAVPLGVAPTPSGRRRPALLAAADLCRHVFVEGRSGTGKTTFAVALAHEFSRRGIGFTLLEHHGSGVDQALRALAPAQAARAVVVRHGDPTAPGSVNLFDVGGDEVAAGAGAAGIDAVREQTISEFIELVQRIFDPRAEGIVGPRWRRWFSLLCDGTVAYWGAEATLLHVLAVASDPALVTKLAAKLASGHRDLSHRLHREIGSLRGDEAANLPAWAISKFQPLVGSRVMREIVGRPRDSVDVTRVIDEGRPLLIDLGGPVVGTGSARMLGALWLLKHWVAMGRRADRGRPHVIIVDEAHLMTVGALPAMLAEARKFGIGVVVLGQSIDALSPDLQSAVEANVGTHLSFRLGLNTVARASLRLDGWDPRELVRLPDLTAAATLTRDGVQSDPFLLTVRRPPIDTPEAFAQARAVDERCAAQARAAAARPVVSDEDIERALTPTRPARRTPSHPSPGSSPTADSAPHGDPASAGSTDTRPTPIVLPAPPSALDAWLAHRTSADPAASSPRA